jgi:hypothetical protein
MLLREINRTEHKKRLEMRKKSIEGDIKEVITQEKTAKENLAIKKKTTKKKVVDKKAMREKQKAVAEKIMDDVRQGNINIEKNLLEEEPEESKVVITKEERAERFKRLHAMVQEMMKKRNE